MSDKKKDSGKCEAESIWEEIQNLSLDIFGLPGQKVSDHCTPQFIEPSKTYLIVKSQAVLPALEETVKKGFSVDRVDKWITVERKKVLSAS